MRSRRAVVMIAWCSAVTMSTLESVHLQGFLSERLPRSLVELLPAAIILAFTVALYLSHAKHPHVVIEGTFAMQGTAEHERSGIFVGNVGDSPVTNVMVDSMGNESFGVSFDPVSSVAVGDHKPVTMRYGSEVRDMFGVGPFLSMKNVVIRDPGQRTESVPHPIRFTYENANGRTEVNEEFELRFIVGIGRVSNRYIVGKRSKVRRTIRNRLGIFLGHLAVRVLQRSPNGE